MEGRERDRKRKRADVGKGLEKIIHLVNNHSQQQNCFLNPKTEIFTDHTIIDGDLIEEV